MHALHRMELRSRIDVHINVISIAAHSIWDNLFWFRLWRCVSTPKHNTGTHSHRSNVLTAYENLTHILSRSHLFLCPSHCISLDFVITLLFGKFVDTCILEMGMIERETKYRQINRECVRVWGRFESFCTCVRFLSALIYTIFVWRDLAASMLIAQWWKVTSKWQPSSKQQG